MVYASTMCAINTFYTVDLTATGITATSATIGWSVASRRGSQEYVINYGTSQNSLNTESSTVTSDTSDSATDETYEVVLTSLTLDTTYYYQVVTTLVDFTLKSDITSFTTLESGIYSIVLCTSYLN